MKKHFLISLALSLFPPLGRAADLALSPPAISKAGNIQIEAKGAAGTAVLIELSPDLTNWVAQEAVQLTDGQNTFYLRPNPGQLYCRIRPATDAENPHPASFSFTPNGDFIRSMLMSYDGATAKLADDNGFSYEFTLGPDSSMALTTLTMQVVNQTQGLPPGLTYLGGVTLAPAGMVVFGDATLSITAPEGTDLTHSAILAWDTGGAELHFTPFDVSANRATINVNRLGGFGLVLLNGADISSVADSVPTDLNNQMDQKYALRTLRSPQNRALHAFSAPEPFPPFSCADLKFMTEHVDYYYGKLRAAVANDSLLESALSAYRHSQIDESRLPEPCFAPVLAKIDQCDSLALQAILNSADNAANRCRRDRDLHALIRLWRDAYLLTRGRWSRKLSLAEHERVRDLLHELLEFKVEFLSSTSAQSNAGTVRTSVSCELEAKWQLVVLDSGKRQLKISGDADITLDSTAWDNPHPPCTATPAPSNGHAYIKYLNLENRQLDVENVIINSDDDIPLPRYTILIDPMVPPPSENYILSCPPAPAVRLTASHWAAAFGSLHKSELTRDAGQSLYFIQGFKHESNSQPDKKEYYQTGGDGDLFFTESTAIRISFPGGSR